MSYFVRSFLVYMLVEREITRDDCLCVPSGHKGIPTSTLETTTVTAKTVHAVKGRTKMWKVSTGSLNPDMQREHDSVTLLCKVN